MKPIDQTILAPRQYDGKTFGNCVQAALASILECNIEDIPFCPHPERLAYSQVLINRGLTIIKTRVTDVMPGFHLICGLSPRTQLGADGKTEFPIHHAVVGFKGEIVFDPHPSRAGLQSWEDFFYVVKLLQ